MAKPPAPSAITRIGKMIRRDLLIRRSGHRGGTPLRYRPDCRSGKEQRRIAAQLSDRVSNCGFGVSHRSLALVRNGKCYLSDFRAVRISMAHERIQLTVRTEIFDVFEDRVEHVLGNQTPDRVTLAPELVQRASS